MLHVEAQENASMGCRFETRQTKQNRSEQGTAGLTRTKLPPHARLNFREGQVFFVHKGKGTVILDDRRTPVEEGSVVYIPPGTWHGFEANDDMQLVWLISPPHFVELYRLFFKPGSVTTKEQDEKLKQKYGYRVKPVE
jgi:quercetin dioxygenase-like cupin family protein